jgi:N-dimethylarginine dimethylaminohydrolase
MIPWTKMPSHWDRKGEEFVVKKKYNELNTAGSVEDQVRAIGDFLVSYNVAEFDGTLSLGDSEGGEDEGDEEGEEDEEDE